MQIHFRPSTGFKKVSYRSNSGGYKFSRNGEVPCSFPRMDPGSKNSPFSTNEANSAGGQDRQAGNKVDNTEYEKEILKRISTLKTK